MSARGHNSTANGRPLAILVAAAAARDDGAFAELVRRFQDAAVAYAAAILGDYDVAEDASQDAFVDVHRLLPTLREPDAFASWLRTIVFKHAHRHQRRSKRLVRLADAPDIRSSVEGADDALVRAESVDAVRRAIARLPERERSVVLLFYLAGQPQTAIADFLGVNANTVKTRLYSARRRLRAMMDGMLEESLGREAPSNDPRFVRRVLSSVLPVEVFSVDGTGRVASAGAVISARTAEIPQTPLWFVEPRREFAAADWDRLIGLMRSVGIPGLAGAGQLTDSVLHQVSGLEHVTYLDLSDCPAVTDDGLAVLARCVELEHLDVSGTSITNAGLRVLASLPRLRVFEARHLGAVSDEGASHLREAPALERVNLMGTASGDGAIRALAGKENLREIFLGNAITDAGISALSDVPNLHKWRGKSPDMSLLSGEARGNFLWISLASRITDKGLRSIGALNGLGGLSLFGGGTGTFDMSRSTVTSDGLASLTGLPHLEWLGCAAALCDDAAMRHVAGMPALRFLMCQDTVAGDAGFSALADSPSIEFVWGRRCHNLGPTGFTRLSTMPNLRGLAVSCRNLGPTGLSVLPEFPRLGEFVPIDVTDQGFEHIGQCVRLEALHCMYCQTITDRAAEFIRHLRSLRDYRAWNTSATDRTLQILAEIRSLEHIRISGCTSMSDRGLRALVELPRLRAIELHGLPLVTIEGATMFAPRVRVSYVP
jgi:RNA polymerase sigma factor (sigma-70 family)